MGVTSCSVTVLWSVVPFRVPGVLGATRWPGEPRESHFPRPFVRHLPVSRTLVNRRPTFLCSNTLLRLFTSTRYSRWFDQSLPSRWDRLRTFGKYSLGRKGHYKSRIISLGVLDCVRRFHTEFGLCWIKYTLLIYKVIFLYLRLEVLLQTYLLLPKIIYVVTILKVSTKDVSLSSIALRVSSIRWTGLSTPTRS